jgi:hypothetical protein
MEFLILKTKLNKGTDRLLIFEDIASSMAQNGLSATIRHPFAAVPTVLGASSETRALKDETGFLRCVLNTHVRLDQHLRKTDRRVWNA